MSCIWNVQNSFISFVRYRVIQEGKIQDDSGGKVII